MTTPSDTEPETTKRAIQFDNPSRVVSSSASPLNNVRDSPETKQSQESINELDFKIAVTATPEQQLLQLRKWLNFKVISIPNIHDSLGNKDLSVEYYKLLTEFNKLVHIICENNIKLNMIKFKCTYLIDEMLKDYNQGEVISDEGENKEEYSEILEKLQDLFDPKEEFDSSSSED